MVPTFISVNCSLDGRYEYSLKRTYPITRIILIESRGDDQTLFTVSSPGSIINSLYIKEKYEDVLHKLETETKVPSFTYMSKILILRLIISRILFVLVIRLSVEDDLITQMLR